jgi:hypothetical protein
VHIRGNHWDGKGPPIGCDSYSSVLYPVAVDRARRVASIPKERRRRPPLIAQDNPHRCVGNACHPLPLSVYLSLFCLCFPASRSSSTDRVVLVTPFTHLAIRHSLFFDRTQLSSWLGVNLLFAFFIVLSRERTRLIHTCFCLFIF